MGLKLGQDEVSTEGIWVNVAWSEASGYLWWTDAEPALSDDGDADARLKVARQNNPEARAYGRKIARKTRHLTRRAGGDLPDQIVMGHLRSQYAHTVLLDWDGVEFPDGSTPDYTPERGIDAFEADEQFLDLVIDISNTQEAFRAEELEEDAEALGNGSDGRSDGEATSASLEALA